MNTNAFLLIAVLLLFNSCSKDSEPGPIDIPIEERLQMIIDEKIGTETEKLMGVSVSIRVDGEEKWKLVGGLSKLNTPITSDMKFGIGSITKTTIAATILKLLDEGSLTLEDTIGDWLTISSPNVDPTITIFQLLTHFTGLKGYFAHPDIWPIVEGNLDHSIPPEKLFEYIGEPVNEPGVMHQYSNSNYLLLGLIIEAVTNQTVGEVMRDKFWTPLQLNNIYFGSNETVPNPIATPWRDSDGDTVLEDISGEYRAAYYSVFYGAAGVFSTASDLSMWANHLYNGNALSLLSKNRMITSYVDIPDPVFTGYGMGARRNKYANRVMWGHTGGMRGYGSHLFYDPISKVSIAILNNQSRSVEGPVLRHELIEELLAEVFDSL